MTEAEPPARRVPLRAAPIRSTGEGPAAHVDVAVSLGDHRRSPLAFLFPKGGGGGSTWGLRFYGFILFWIVVMGLRILNLSTSFGDRESSLTGFLAYLAVAVGTVALIFGLAFNGLRRERRKARRAVPGSLWASPVGDAATRRNGEVISSAAGGRGSIVLSSSGMAFVASPRQGVSGASTWSDIVAIELTVKAPAARGRTDQRILVRSADGQELSVRTRVDRGAQLTLASLGAVVPDMTFG